MKKLILVCLLSFPALFCMSQSAEEHYSLALGKYSVGEYKAAIAEFSKAIDIEPSYSAYSKRGEARLKNHDEKEAAEDFTKAILLRPNLAETYHFRGLARQRSKDYANAIQDFNKAISISPTYAQAYCSRAEVKIKLKDSDGALDDYKKATLSNPTDVNAFMGLANLSVERGDKSSACEAFNKAYQLGNEKAKSEAKRNCK